MVRVFVHANCAQMPEAAHPGCWESGEHGVPSFKACAEHKHEGNCLLGHEVLSLPWFVYVLPLPSIPWRHRRKVSCDLSGITHPQEKGAEKSGLLGYLHWFQGDLCWWVFCLWGEYMPTSSRKKARKASGLGTEQFWWKALMKEGCGTRDAISTVTFQSRKNLTFKTDKTWLYTDIQSS